MMSNSNIDKTSVLKYHYGYSDMSPNSIKSNTCRISLCGNSRYLNDMINIRNFITIINRIENKEYKLEDIIENKYINDVKDIYILIDKDISELKTYKCTGYYIDDEYSEVIIRLIDLYINYVEINNIFLKIKTININNTRMEHGYIYSTHKIRDKKRMNEMNMLTEEICNNVSKDVINYIVMEYLEEENLLAELDSDLYKELNLLDN